MDAYASLQDDRTIRVERAAENNLQQIDVEIHATSWWWSPGSAAPQPSLAGHPSR